MIDETTRYDFSVGGCNSKDPPMPLDFQTDDNFVEHVHYSGLLPSRL